MAVRSTWRTRCIFPHSLGIFYEAMTQYLGFPHYGDEYKVMGLAPYGEPRFLDAMRRIVLLQKDGGYELDLRYFRHAREKVDYEWDGGSPRSGRSYRGAGGIARARKNGKDEPLDPVSSRRRAIGAGDVRGSVFPSVERGASPPPGWMRWDWLADVR